MAEARPLVSPARVFARPTADQIWLGPAQRAALSQLSRPTRARVLLGPPSSGKSSLLNHLTVRLGTAAVVLHCRGPKEDAAAVLATLLLSADLGPWELSEIEQRNLFTVFVQQRHSQHRRVVLVIDDAHTLKAGAWQEIERLLAFRIDKTPAIDVLLAGPPSLAGRLDSMGLDRHEICVHQLDCPTPPELMGYVEWRLGQFAMNKLVTRVASQMIARLSGGRYAAVDVLCQMSLLLRRQLKLERVDARVARQAIATLAARQSARLEPAISADNSQRLDLPPQGYLLISRSGKVLTRRTLGQRTLIGRSEHNDICLPSPYLSRHHAAIVGTPEGYYAIDLNSIHGLSLNGRLIQRAVLYDQDLLSIGPFRLKVQIPEWLPHSSPFSEGESLADTAVTPLQQPADPANIRRVQ